MSDIERIEQEASEIISWISSACQDMAGSHEAMVTAGLMKASEKKSAEELYEDLAAIRELISQRLDYGDPDIQLLLIAIYKEADEDSVIQKAAGQLYYLAEDMHAKRKNS